MKLFPKLGEALSYALQHISDPKRSFLIDVQTPDDRRKGHACSIQFVDQSIVSVADEAGVAMYLAFDKTTGSQMELERFRCLQERSQFTDISDDPDIECFAMAFGSDVSKAVLMASIVLVSVYHLTVDDEIACTFYDQTNHQMNN